MEKISLEAGVSVGWMLSLAVFHCVYILIYCGL